MIKKTCKQCLVYILRLEARLLLHKYKPHIIAVTGSVGKTSTKDAVFAVVGERYRVRKSDKNFNTEIGLPLTILGCPNGWNNPLIWLKNIFKGFNVYIL
jgi:UDP-N-acetylmuramoyl-tripeptide--D-alanyl-D-alanine ligase